MAQHTQGAEALNEDRRDNWLSCPCPHEHAPCEATAELVAAVHYALALPAETSPVVRKRLQAALAFAQGDTSERQASRG